MIWRGGYEDEDDSQFSPIDARRAVAILSRLPRPFGVGGAMDGRGKGSSCRPTTRRIFHALPPSPRRVRSVEKDHPKPCRQYVASRRRDHPRRERRASSKKELRGPTCPHFVGWVVDWRFHRKNFQDAAWALFGPNSTIHR